MYSKHAPARRKGYVVNRDARRERKQRGALKAAGLALHKGVTAKETVRMMAAAILGKRSSRQKAVDFFRLYGDVRTV
jgi:hypothetical protein